MYETTYRQTSLSTSKSMEPFINPENKIIIPVPINNGGTILFRDATNERLSGTIPDNAEVSISVVANHLEKQGVGRIYRRFLHDGWTM